jgi:hypothetical protein
MLKLGQKELANMVGCSTRTIQSVELRTLALSESLARKISSETAVAVEWLLENDLRAPLIGDDYKPFTVEHYNERRRLRDLELPTLRGAHVSATGGEPHTIIFYAWMRAIFQSKDGDIALWQTGKFLEKLAEKYGYDRGVVSMPLKVAALRDHKLLWRQAKIGMQLAERYTRRYRKGKLRPGKHGGFEVGHLLRPRSRSRPRSHRR